MPPMKTARTATMDAVAEGPRTCISIELPTLIPFELQTDRETLREHLSGATESSAGGVAKQAGGGSAPMIITCENIQA